MCGATDGPQRTDFSAADVPGDHFFCRGRSGGTRFGGTNFRVTVLTLSSHARGDSAESGVHAHFN